MKRLLLIGLMFFALGAEEMPPTEIPPEEPIEIPLEITPEPIIEPEPEITPKPTEEVFPEIPPELMPEIAEEPTPEFIPEETPPIATEYNFFYGCTNKSAVNYLPSTRDYRVIEDGSCYFVYGCTDPAAVNYISNAVKDDGTCVYPEGYEFPQPEPESEPVDIFAEPEPVYIFEDFSDIIEASME